MTDGTYVGPEHPSVAGKTGAGVVVAVVDSGVAAGHAHVGEVSGGITIDEHGREHQGFADALGHGTAVTAAIREKAPDVSVLAVKVFERALVTTARQLVRAIDWAAANGADLVNLSLGTQNDEHRAPLGEALDRATARDTLVVSAYGHEGSWWFPGSLPGAVPVTLDEACPRAGLRLRQRDGVTVLAASPFPRPIPNVPVERNLHGVSFAVANVTGVLACLAEGRDGMGREWMYDLLQT